MARRNRTVTNDKVEVETTAEVVEEVVETPVAKEVVEPVEEVTPVVEEVTTPVAVEAVAAVVEEKPVINNATIDGFIRLELESYQDAMAVGKYITPTAGNTQQIKLYRIIDRIFNRVKDEDYPVAIKTLLDWIVETTDTVMSTAYMFRFSPQWTITQDEYQAFVRLLTMLKLISNPKTKSIVTKDMNVDYYTAFGLNDKGRERVLTLLGK